MLLVGGEEEERNLLPWRDSELNGVYELDLGWDPHLLGEMFMVVTVSKEP